MIRSSAVTDRQQVRATRPGGELRRVRRLIAICLVALAAAGGGLVTTVANTTAWFNAKSGESERARVETAVANVIAARPQEPAAARRLAAELGLQGARVSPREGSPDIELSIRLPGEAPAFLVWTAPQLGTVGMLNFAPTRVPLILGVVGAVALLLFKLDRLARALDRERRLAGELASTDALTGLGNRRAFHEELDRRFERGRPFALACLDLDGFKGVNDHHGHAAGDAVLSSVAKRLGRILESSDSAFRLGGDEFALLLDSEERDLLRFAKKIVLAIDDNHQLDATARARVGVSIGIALAPSDANAAERLISKADAALYRAKEERGSAFRFAADLPAPAVVSAA